MHVLQWIRYDDRLSNSFYDQYYTVAFLRSVPHCIALCSIAFNSILQYCTALQLYCIVQYSAVQCSTVQYSTVQCSAVQYSTVQYSTVQYSTVQCSTVQYSTVQYSTVQYSTKQYSTVQCSTVREDQRIRGLERRSVALLYLLLCHLIFR